MTVYDCIIINVEPIVGFSVDVSQSICMILLNVQSQMMLSQNGLSLTNLKFLQSTLIATTVIPIIATVGLCVHYQTISLVVVYHWLLQPLFYHSHFIFLNKFITVWTVSINIFFYIWLYRRLSRIQLPVNEFSYEEMNQNINNILIPKIHVRSIKFY